MPDINIYIPCFIDQLYPQTAVRLVSLLKQLDFHVHYNPAQTCCGQPAYNAGFDDEARQISQKMLADLQTLPKAPILCPSASCTGYANHAVPQLCGPNPQFWECSQFLIQEVGIDKLRQRLQPRLKARATYHDACSALRECNIKAAPRQLLSLVEGLELIESPDAEVCCGFGGTFASKFEPISVAMAEQKVNTALALNVEYIISTDWSCLMQLDSYIKKKKYPLQVMHLLDVLAHT